VAPVESATEVAAMRVLPGGSDWQRDLPDGSLRLDCRIVLDTTQGALIAMTWIARHVVLIELSAAPSIFHP
jgi:hypothetical protein